MPSLAYRLLVAFSVAAFAVAFAVAAWADEQQPTAHARLIGADGQAMGEATFTEGPTGTLILIQLHGAPPGPHGVHLHGVGLCDAAGGFESAGSHIGADGAMHGLLAVEGPHAGDLPSVDVDAAGEANVEFFNTHVVVKPGEATFALLDDDGSSIVVHESADDQMTQPGGGTGKRIACGAIEAAN
jgi:Cu-Zn family superoxide dismutase